MGKESLIKKIENEINKQKTIFECDCDDLFLQVSDRPELADYQINACFKIGKMLKQNPFDIATKLADAIKDINIDGIKAFSLCDPCKPGFVNIKLNDSILLKEVINIHSDSDLCVKEYINDSVKDIAKNGVLLDYGGANVAKPLHVGHLRVAVIGEAVKRLYERLGKKTISDVHLGDYGLQMGLVIEKLKDENKTDDFTITDLETLYPMASKQAKLDEAFSERAHIATKRLQDDEEPETSIWKKIVDISIEDLKKRYAELNVFFDYYYGESTVKDIMGPMVDEFVKDGIAYESEGATVIDVKEDTDKKEMPPCIVRKSDGATLYATSDIATIKFREEQFDVDEYIYVVDKRQSLHLEQCFRASKKANILKRDKKFTHIAVGTMNGQDGTPFKTRDGGVVSLLSLINEATEKALSQINENKENKDNLKDYGETETNKLANIIAISALKYGDLSNSPTRDYVFDMNKFLSFQGNTGPYILYSLVRIKSIIEKTCIDINNINFSDLLNDDSILNDDLIHSIYLKTIEYPSMLSDAIKNYDPSIICKYIFELANDFNSFYHDHNILNETNISKKNLYILILGIIDRILRDALNILAIDVPERM